MEFLLYIIWYIKSGEEKRCRTDKLSKTKASYLVLLARRRTEVRRVAKLVRSIKYIYSINLMVLIFLKGSTGLIPAEPLCAISGFIWSVLFYIRFWVIAYLTLKKTYLFSFLF